jgi:hypothetical protein
VHGNHSSFGTIKWFKKNIQIISRNMLLILNILLQRIGNWSTHDAKVLASVSSWPRDPGILSLQVRVLKIGFLVLYLASYTLGLSSFFSLNKLNCDGKREGGKRTQLMSRDQV